MSSWTFATDTTPASAPHPGPQLAVQVAGLPIAPAKVAHAEQRCARDEPKMPVRTCIDTYFVPRWLLDQRVRDQKLESTPAAQALRADLLHLALLEHIARAVPMPSEAEIDHYIAQHQRDFAKPLRLRIFRLLVATEEDARRVLAELKMPLDLAQFRAACRAHSIDKATSERGGDLGFVWPDGSTDVPQVSADPALYQAALGLTEGQLLDHAVREGDHFAIVWRRGSLPATGPDAAERRRVSELIREAAIEARTQALLERLQKEQVKGRADVLLGRLRRKDTLLFQEP